MVPGRRIGEYAVTVAFTRLDVCRIIWHEGQRELRRLGLSRSPLAWAVILWALAGAAVNHGRPAT